VLIAMGGWVDPYDLFTMAYFGAALQQLALGGIRAGDVIVLRMMGHVGGPGTIFACSFMAALVGAGLSESVAVVTNGELSGLNRGITIGQVMSEAACGDRSR
jgi:dihydroxy-acid dehydratase